MERRLALALALALAAVAACKNAQPCPKPLEECSGSCVDVQSDRRDCGACGTSCRAGEVCTAGTCRLDAQAPCPVRAGGAFVTLRSCDATVKVWVRQPDFIDEAASYLVSTAVPRTPVFAVSAGSDCDGQWSWRAGADTAVFQSPVASVGCDVCPVDIQANVPAFVAASGHWCPSDARVLAVDRRPAP